MSVAFRNGSTGQATAAGLTFSLPTGIQDGDVGLCIWSTGNAADTLTPPSGWTMLGSATVTQSQITAVFVKVLTAAESGASRTWTKSNTGKHAAVITVYSGVDNDDIIGAIDVVGSTNVTSATRISPAVAAEDLAIEFAASKGTDPGEWTVPTGFTSRGSIAQSSTGSITVAVAESASDLDGANTWTLAAAWPQAAVGGLWLVAADDPPPPTPGTVDHIWTGAPEDTSAVVVVKTSGATSVRLAVSESSDMSDPTYVSAEIPDTYGLLRYEVTGLSPNTRYYFQAADTPSGGSETLIGAIATLKTLQTPGTPVASRSVSLGSCIRTNTANVSAIEDVLSWSPDWGLFLGDFFYNGNQSTVESEWVGKYVSQIAGVDHLDEMVAAGVLAYEVPSDHDTTNIDNGDSNGPQAPYEQAAWRKIVPFGTTGASDVRDQQWQDGRVSYFMVDCRSPYRSPGSDTDGPSKTMLGADQLARLLDWIENDPAPFKVFVSDVGWMGNADIVAKPDSWWSYANERQIIIDAIAEHESHIEIWHGDSHLIGYATAAKNTWGNIPVICAAPYESPGGGRNTSTFSEYFNNSSGDPAMEYGRITITDDGSKITRTFEGYDAISDTVKMTFVTEVDTVAPDTPLVDYWNGSGWDRCEVVGFGETLEKVEFV